MHTAPKIHNDDFTDTDWKVIAQSRGKVVRAQIDTIEALKEHLDRSLHNLVACQKTLHDLIAERDKPAPDVDTDS